MISGVITTVCMPYLHWMVSTNLALISGRHGRAHICVGHAMMAGLMLPCNHAGNCLDEVTRYCASVDPGDGKLADCISDLIAESEVVTDGERSATLIRIPHDVRQTLVIPVLFVTCFVTHAPAADPHADTAPVISDACREEAYQFKISRNANINLNVPLGG